MENNPDLPLVMIGAFCLTLGGAGLLASFFANRRDGQRRKQANPDVSI